MLCSDQSLFLSFEQMEIHFYDSKIKSLDYRHYSTILLKQTQPVSRCAFIKDTYAEHEQCMSQSNREQSDSHMVCPLTASSLEESFSLMRTGF